MRSEEENQICALCKHLDCTRDGRFCCDLDGEIIMHEGEGRGCQSYEEYQEDNQ